MKWRVPLADVTIGEDEIIAVEDVLRSGWLSMGKITEDFERAFADYLGVRYAFAVANGTVALHLAYAALDIGPGNEVILPSLTFVATANAVLYTDAVPIFADIKSLDDLTISAEKIEPLITSRTKAIVVMHYGGYLCDMELIIELARKYDLAVVEDAAHAPGATYRGMEAGTLGDVGCFSFFANKNMTTGEGGMVVTNREDLAEKIRLMRSHGMTTLTWDRHRGHAFSYDVALLGYNYRIDEMRSALGLVQLKKLEMNNRRREEITRIYRRELADCPGIRLPFNEHRRGSTYHLFPIILDEMVERRKFMEYMRSLGIQTSIHYPPVHLFDYYRRRFGYGKGMLPLTEMVGRREVTLPLYPSMSDEQAALVVNSVRSFWKANLL